MALKDKLIEFLPLVYRNSTVLNEFLSAIGELFDNFSITIDNMKDYSDPLNLDEERLEQLAIQLGINFPRNLGLDAKRSYVAEVVDLYKSNGTTRSLVRSFKLLGWTVDVVECWIVHPSYYDSQSVYTLTNDETGQFIDLEKYDIIFGTEKQYGDETFVDLFDRSNSQYVQRPIYGEVYKGAVSNPLFVKVPYIRIDVNSENYDIILDPTYQEEEEFFIVEQIREHFIELARPAHVAILEIATAMKFENSEGDVLRMGFKDSLFDIQTINAGQEYDGTWAYGTSIDRYILGETMGDFEYGTSNMSYYGVDQDAPDEIFTRQYDKESPRFTTGFEYYIPLRKINELDISVPYDTKINLYGLSDDRIDLAQGTRTRTLIGNYENVQNQIVNVEGFNAVEIRNESYVDSENLLFNALSPLDDYTVDTEIIKGVGSGTYSRSSIAFLRDWENNLVEVETNEARFQGSRRVKNYILHSEDFNNPVYFGRNSNNTFENTKEISPPSSLHVGTVVGKLSFNDNSGNTSMVQVVNVGGITNNNSWLVSYWVWIPSTVSSWRTYIFENGDIPTAVDLGTFPKDQWIRFQFLYEPTTASTGNINVDFHANFVDPAGTYIYVCAPQLEKVTGQTLKVASEYQKTLTNTVTKIYWSKNENTESGNIVTENPSIPLTPTRKVLGANVFDTYDEWVLSNSYSVGSRVIPTSGSGPAGGNGFYYEVSSITTGTSGVTEPVWPEIIGNTVVDSGVTWTCKGHYTFAGYIAEPSRTNMIPDSYDLTQWTQTGTAVSSLDEVGIDGVRNKATTLTDDDAVNFEEVRQVLTVPNDSDTHVGQTFIKKDSDETRFPEIGIGVFNGSVAVFRLVQINTKTGNVVVRSQQGVTDTWVEDYGDWWRLVHVIVNNTTGNTALNYYIRPAYGTTIGVADNTATGSCIIGHTQIELNAKVPTSPIITNGSSGSRSFDDLFYPNTNILATNGTILADYTQLSVSTSGEVITSPIISTRGVSSGEMYHQNNLLVSFDGAAGVGGDNSNPGFFNFEKNKIKFSKCGVRYNSTTAKMSAIVNAISSSDTTFGGSFEQNSDLKIIRPDSLERPSIVKNIRIYNTDLGSSKLLSLTDNNDNVGLYESDFIDLQVTLK